MTKFGLDNSIPTLVQGMFVTLLFSLLSNLLLEHLFSQQVVVLIFIAYLWAHVNYQFPLQIAAALKPTIKRMFVIAYSITAPNVLLVYVEHRVGITLVALF